MAARNAGFKLASTRERWKFAPSKSSPAMSVTLRFVQQSPVFRRSDGRISGYEGLADQLFVIRPALEQAPAVLARPVPPDGASTIFDCASSLIAGRSAIYQHDATFCAKQYLVQQKWQDVPQVAATQAQCCSRRLRETLLNGRLTFR